MLTAFLHRVLCRSGRYEPEIISLALSSSDAASVGVRRPRTWGRGVQTVRRRAYDLEYTHVGAMVSELEWQRYRPRRQLTSLLSTFDIIQLVVGTPPWGCVVPRPGPPVALWTATTTWADRSQRVSRKSLPSRLWALAMSAGAEHYERRTLERADLVFGLSAYTVDALRRKTSRPILLGTPGVDLDTFRPAACPSGEYLLTVGRHYDARKNVPLLLRAFASLLRSTGGAESPSLYFVGDDPIAADKALVASLGLGPNVRFLGYQDEGRLAELYANAAAVVLASDEEGLGLVLLEAMASGAPVVSTDSGGPATAVVHGETGFLTPVGDEALLTRALLALWEDPALRRRMGAAGRARAEEVFSIERAGSVFVDQYDSLLAGRRDRRAIA